MGSYKLADEAEADLIRIHQWGVRNHGEEQADRYFAAFFDHFEQLADQPLLYSVTDKYESINLFKFTHSSDVFYDLLNESQGIEVHSA